MKIIKYKKAGPTAKVHMHKGKNNYYTKKTKKNRVTNKT